MICPNCGKELLEGSKFCAGCGLSLGQLNVVPAKKISPSPLVIIGVVLGGLGLLAVLGFGGMTIYKNMAGRKDNQKATASPKAKAVDSQGTVHADKFDTIDAAYDFAKSKVDYKNKGLCLATVTFDSGKNVKVFDFAFADKDSYVQKDIYTAVYKAKEVSFVEDGTVDVRDYNCYGMDKAKELVVSFDTTENSLDHILEAGKQALISAGKNLGTTYRLYFDTTMSSQTHDFTVWYSKAGTPVNYKGETLGYQVTLKGTALTPDVGTVKEYGAYIMEVVSD